MLIPAIIRGLSGIYKTGSARGLEHLEISILKSNSKGLPYKLGERVTITLLINSVSYLAGVRATQDWPYIWICPNLRSEEGADVKLAYILKVEGFHKNQRINLEVIGDAIRLLPPSSSITISLTQGGIDNHYVRLPIAKYPDFFPPNSIGGSNSKEAGKFLSIYLEGLDEKLKTDIDGSKNNFRGRGWSDFSATINFNQEMKLLLRK